MITIRARNVNDALLAGLDLAVDLEDKGHVRDSRNGPVVLAPEPVTTVYREPRERVLFWSDRDANPFFHLMEALWMLDGRRDVEFPARFVKRMRTFSDDGKTLHGAYGHRWRTFFGYDQIEDVVSTLTLDPNCRRQVIAMWDAHVDLGRKGKDIPCNLVAHVEVNGEGAVDLTVFCRSNDAIWGAYGANAVHFSILQEYIASRLGREVGRYWQVSSNWHVYLNDVYRRTRRILAAPGPERERALGRYDDASLVAPLAVDEPGSWRRSLRRLLDGDDVEDEPFFRWVAVPMLRAHEAYKANEKPAAFEAAYRELSDGTECDWTIAGREWIERRERRWREGE